MSCNSKIILSTRQKNTQSFIFRYTIFIKILYFYKPYIALDLGTYYKMVFVNKNCNSKTRANAIILFLALLILSVWECKTQKTKLENTLHEITHNCNLVAVTFIVDVANLFGHTYRNWSKKL